MGSCVLQHILTLPGADEDIAKQYWDLIVKCEQLEVNRKMIEDFVHVCCTSFDVALLQWLLDFSICFYSCYSIPNII